MGRDEDEGIPVDLSALLKWMDGQGLGVGPLDEVIRLTGGTQNILLRFRRGYRTYVLRRPPVNLRANSSETMRREARVLGALAGTSVAHPRLIAACLDESVMGAAFYLMEAVEGFNATAGLPLLHAGSQAIRHRMGLALVEGIAELGALDYRVLGLEGFGRPDNYLERQVGRWRSQLTSYRGYSGWDGKDVSSNVERIGAWLEAHCPIAFEPGIIHGDYHIANVIYEPNGPELAAIVDWELATIGDPLLDLAWLVTTWPQGENPGPASVCVQPWRGFPTAKELMEHYRTRTQRDLSAFNWYLVLACYKRGIILEGTHARACAGLVARERGDVFHLKSTSLFERALQWIG
jgi:aminoglycoside phosphotransferase (APT) family kinase protein